MGSEEVGAFERVRDIIDQYCKDSKQDIEDETDKLIYMAKALPDVFSEGTPFAIHSLSKSWKKDKKP